MQLKGKKARAECGAQVNDGLLQQPLEDLFHFH